MECLVGVAAEHHTQKQRIYNKNNSYSVYGSLFGIVMDADIKQDSYNNQLRFLAPNVHMQTNEGQILESRGKLYELNN